MKGRVVTALGKKPGDEALAIDPTDDVLVKIDGPRAREAEQRSRGVGLRVPGAVQRRDERRTRREGGRQRGQATGMQAPVETSQIFTQKKKKEVPLQVNGATGQIGTHQSRMEEW